MFWIIIEAVLAIVFGSVITTIPMRRHTSKLLQLEGAKHEYSGHEVFSRAWDHGYRYVASKLDDETATALGIDKSR